MQGTCFQAFWSVGRVPGCTLTVLGNSGFQPALRVLYFQSDPFCAISFMQYSFGDPHATDLQTQEVKSVRVWRMKIRSGSIVVKYSGYYTCVILQYILNDTGGCRMEEMRQKNQEDLCLLACFKR
jgi:hypothetical protein